MRAEDAIARVAEARHDVALLVESFVDRSGVHHDIWVQSLHHSESFRCSDEAHELNRLHAELLQDLHCMRCTTASGEHGIHQDHGTERNLIGQL